jgi:hypothetical protein
MSMANHKVIAAWKDGKKAVNGRKSLSTDGKWLYSYRLAIGYRTSNGICVLGNYTSGGGSFRSVTTSCHIVKARRVVSSDLIWHPAVFEASKDAFATDTIPTKEG